MKIVNKKKFRKSIATLIISIIAIGFMVWLTVDTIEYPEKYLTTWRYQLHRKVQNGDEDAIKYYQEVYLNKNIKLWED